MADGETNGPAHVNRELVRLLESALTDAKAGRIVAGGIVAVVGPSSALCFSSYGRHPFEVIGAAEMLKADVLAKMRTNMRSPIVRPGAGIPGLPTH